MSYIFSKYFWRVHLAKNVTSATLPISTMLILGYTLQSVPSSFPESRQGIICKCSDFKHLIVVCRRRIRHLGTSFSVYLECTRTNEPRVSLGSLEDVQRL